MIKLAFISTNSIRLVSREISLLVEYCSVPKVNLEWIFSVVYEASWTSHPLQQTHLLEVRAGVGQSLQSVCQIIVGAEVKAVCGQHIVNHGQEGLILLRLEEERKQTFRFQENSCRSTFQRAAHSCAVSSVKYIKNYCPNQPAWWEILLLALTSTLTGSRQVTSLPEAGSAPVKGVPWEGPCSMYLYMHLHTMFEQLAVCSHRILTFFFSLTGTLNLYCTSRIKSFFLVSGFTMSQCWTQTVGQLTESAHDSWLAVAAVTSDYIN